MWKNFILVSIRNILKNKSFTFINIAGLTIGITSAVFIILFIISELSYDRHYQNADRIFRLYVDSRMWNSELRGAWTCPPAGPVLMEEIPEIEDYTRIVKRGQVLVKVDEKKYLEENLIYADSGFFHLFDFPVIYGDPELMLNQPYSLVLTESLSLKYFGEENPVGRAIETDIDTSLFTITGVIRDLPDETHLAFNLIASFSTNPESQSSYWLSSYLFTYFLLDEKESHTLVEEKIVPVIRKHIEPQLIQVMGVDVREYEASGNKYELFLQHLRDIHHDPSVQGGFKIPSDIKYLKIFGFIAAFIILIGSINFMNMSAAKAANRAKEVGMRKISGSGRGLIFKQFLMESVFLSMMSLGFAMIIVEVCLPIFNNMMDLNLKMRYLSEWYTLPGLLILTLFIGLFSGSYPAFLLASFDPVDTLRGRFKTGKTGILVRNILVVVQFTISITIITGTLVIYRQLKYVERKNLGFTRDNVLVLYRLDPVKGRIDAFMQELRNNPAIVKTTNSSIYPGASNTSNSYQMKGRDKHSNIMFNTYWTDPDFLDTYNIHLSSGRFFEKDYPADTASIIINKIALDKYEINDPLNSVLIQPTDDGVGKEFNIIGVIGDFHSASLHEQISPLLIQLKTENHYPGYISIRIEGNNTELADAFRHIQRTWSDFTNNEPMQYFNLTDRLNQYYREEQRSGRLSLVFSLLAIFLACLGLYGLTMYTTEKRAREISIRKVHGASNGRIVLMIIGNISVLLVIATLIAGAISWKVSLSWLEVFAFRIGLDPIIFISGAGLAFLIALLSVSSQAYIAARANPARSLRHE